MRILIITTDIGKTAPGIVYEKLIHGLSELHDVQLLTSVYTPSAPLSKVKKVHTYKYKNSGRLRRYFIALLGVDPLDIFYSRFVSGKDLPEVDLVFSFISFDHYLPLLIGRKLSDKFGVRHFVYSVDGIPAPNGWLEKDAYFLGIQRFVKKYLSGIDGLFSSNRKMLEYQLTTFEAEKNIVTDVIHTPSMIVPLTLENSWEGNVFLYTGGLYGLRNIQHIFKAFKILLHRYPNSLLVFVGSKIEQASLALFTEEEVQKIQIVPFTKDLIPYYQRATALLDIDADIDNDIFLSSKISNYLFVNRIIISETGANSPSREMFKGIHSIFQSGHNPEELARVMEKAILQRDTIQFDDREEVRKLFDRKEIVKKLNTIIEDAY